MKTKWTKDRPTEPGHYWCRVKRDRKWILLMAYLFGARGEKVRGQALLLAGQSFWPKEAVEWWPERIEEPGESGPITWKERALRAEEALAAALNKPSARVQTQRRRP
jgi:hypothetical protein